MTAALVERQCGSYVKYVQDRCRCDACKAANSRYERERRARIAPPYVIAGPARDHVRKLMAQGVGLKTIAKAAGVPHGSLSKLIYGDPRRGMAPSKRIRPATAEKILAVTPSDAAAGSRIPAGPTLEHVATLIERGWTKSAIAQAIGQKGPALQLGGEYVTRRHATAIKALLDQPVPPRRTRYGLVDVEQPPEPEPAPPPAVDERDAFLLEIVEILEERIDQAEWRQHAACRGRPVWMWFPGRGDNETLAAARKICASCTVRDRCAEASAGRTDREGGVYAGLSARQRRGAAA